MASASGEKGRSSNIHKVGWNSSFGATSGQKKNLFGRKRDIENKTPRDIESIAQAAKAKANDFLASKRQVADRSKSHKASKVPNFKKMHEKNFSSQKAITSIVKEVGRESSF